MQHSTSAALLWLALIVSIVAGLIIDLQYIADGSGLGWVALLGSIAGWSILYFLIRERGTPERKAP